MRESQAGLDVLGFQVRVLPQDRLGRVSRRQHPKHMLLGDPHVPDDRLSPEGVRPHGDAIKQFCLAAHGSLHQ